MQQQGTTNLTAEKNFENNTFYYIIHLQEFY